MNQVLQRYKMVAIILIYRNWQDLVECINSMKNEIDSLKIVVVNSYYDEESKNQIEIVAKNNDCDFLNVENRGYSFGNNRGIDFALEHYDFDYIIVANPDIIVKRFNMPEQAYDVIAPRIIARDGKAQNPMLIRRNKISESLAYYGFKNNKKIFLFLSIGLNKFLREVWLRVIKRGVICYPIYQPHGSFVVISKKVIEKIHPIYDENMFLFAEENLLSKKIMDNGFRVFYYAGIWIFHKEDGSMKYSETSISDELKKSNIYFYETYVIKR